MRSSKPAKKEEKQSGGGGSGEGSSWKQVTRSWRRAERPVAAQRMEVKLSLTNDDIEQDFMFLNGH